MFVLDTGTQEAILNDLVSLTADVWTFQTSRDTQGRTVVGQSDVFAGTVHFTATLQNESAQILSDLVIEVADLTAGDRLQNADGGPGGTGARLTVGQPRLLLPQPPVVVPFNLCLKDFAPFRFIVNVRGGVR